MQRRPLLLILLLLFLLGSLLLVPSVRWPVYGWLRGEAFYQGMPVSWWEEEIEARYEPFTDSVSSAPAWLIVETTSPLLHEIKQQISPDTMSVPLPMTIIPVGPLMEGDPDAIPVLLELLRSGSAKVRRLAIAGLKCHAHCQREIVTLLREASKDPDKMVRQDAENALWHFNRKATKAGVK